jgi:hypothetical protein
VGTRAHKPATCAACIKHQASPLIWQRNKRDADTCLRHDTQRRHAEVVRTARATRKSAVRAGCCREGIRKQCSCSGIRTDALSYVASALCAHTQGGGLVELCLHMRHGYLVAPCSVRDVQNRTEQSASVSKMALVRTEHSVVLGGASVRPPACLLSFRDIRL